MTTAQLRALSKCIDAERWYWRAVLAAKGKQWDYVSPDERLVEVGRINGIENRTADVLEAAGLVETAVPLGDKGDCRYIRLAYGGESRLENTERRSDHVEQE